jgi:O-antigen/teichoic acid export membrane protein
MWNNVAALVILPLAFIIGSRWGTGGLAAGWIIGHPVTLFFLYRRAFQRIEMPTARYIAALWPAISSAAVLAAAVLLAGRVAPASWPRGVVLGFEVAAGAAAYAAVMITLHRDRLRAVKRLIARARSGGAPGPSGSGPA